MVFCITNTSRWLGELSTRMWRFQLLALSLRVVCFSSVSQQPTHLSVSCETPPSQQHALVLPVLVGHEAPAEEDRRES